MKTLIILIIVLLAVLSTPLSLKKLIDRSKENKVGIPGKNDLKKWAGAAGSDEGVAGSDEGVAGPDEGAAGPDEDAEPENGDADPESDAAPDELPDGLPADDSNEESDGGSHHDDFSDRLSPNETVESECVVEEQKQRNVE